jgi:hypothetical protein
LKQFKIKYCLTGPLSHPLPGDAVRRRIFDGKGGLPAFGTMMRAVKSGIQKNRDSAPSSPAVVHFFDECSIERF